MFNEIICFSQNIFFDHRQMGILKFRRIVAIQKISVFIHNPLKEIAIMVVFVEYTAKIFRKVKCKNQVGCKLFFAKYGEPVHVFIICFLHHGIGN